MTTRNQSSGEPDYTLTIIQEDGGWVVCEGGVSISKPLADRAEAEWWCEQHRRWHQPRCCVCGSAVTRSDDPWEAYSSSSSGGADWMHKSCMEKFESWATSDEQLTKRGPQRVPEMEVLDAAWDAKHLDEAAP